ncbi:MAG: hypothetical protein WC879_08185 [Melioribacteraceae bacterium]
MTQIKQINTDLIREDPSNPRHPRAIKIVAILYNANFQKSQIIITD